MRNFELWLIKKILFWFISWSHKKIFGKRSIAIFERFLESDNWEKVEFGPTEKWIYKDDNSFVIEIIDNDRSFVEPWTDKFADKKAFALTVNLKLNGELVHKSLTFVLVDGCRNCVPCPKVSNAYDEIYYFWDKNSLEYKIFEKIGMLDSLYPDLERFGMMCGVKLVSL